MGALVGRVADFFRGGHLYGILAIVAIVVATIADLLFVGSSLLPQWRMRSGLAAQFTSAQQQLLAVRRGQGGDPDQLRQQLASAQEALAEKAGIFFSEAQATEILDSLYRYANESDVVVTSLQSQIGPETGVQEAQQEPESQQGERETQQEPDGRQEEQEVQQEPEGQQEEQEEQQELQEQQDAEGEPEQQIRRVFASRPLRLTLDGTVPNLLDFVSRIKQTAYRSFVITNVKVAQGADSHELTMNVILYTSPYSKGVSDTGASEAAPMPTVDGYAQLERSLADAWASDDWQEAIRIINQILSRDPDNDYMRESLYTAHVNYGYQLLEKGDAAEASSQFVLALEITPGGAESLAGLQQASTSPTPTISAEARLEQRLAEAWAASDWEEVISLVKQIAALKPDREDMTEKLYAAHVNYGYRLQGEGKLEEARAEFHAALTVNADGEEALTALRELAGVTPQPTLIPTNVSATPLSGGTHIIHVVRPGETLFGIGRLYGTTPDAIRAANGISGNTIHSGQQLTIPTP